MKRFFLIPILFAALLVEPACTTTGPDGQPVFDTVKTEQVKASIQPVVSTAIRLWLAKEPNPEYRAAATAFSDVICQMRDAKEFDGSVLSSRLSAELDKRNLLNDVWAATAKDFIVAQFNIWIAAKARADLPPDEFAWNLLDTLCRGIKDGLGQPQTPTPTP